MMNRRGHDKLIALAVLIGLAICGPAAAQVDNGTADVSAPAATAGTDAATEDAPFFYDHPIFEMIMFYVFAAGTVISALALCVTKDIVRMAIWLFVTLSMVAMLFFMLSAPFLGAIQLIVYAGGTLILLVFGVMLTSKSPWVRLETKWKELAAAGVVCLVLAAGLIGAVVSTHWTPADQATTTGVKGLGEELLTTYLVPFEAASVLLLVVMIGAAYLIKQERK